MSPELVAAMVKAGVSPDKIALLQSQIQQAQSLQNRPQPEGRAYNGVYRAANPMEYIGQGLETYAANKRLGSAEKGTGLYGQQSQAISDMEKARMEYILKILGKDSGGAAVGTPPPPADMSPTMDYGTTAQQPSGGGGTPPIGMLKSLFGGGGAAANTGEGIDAGVPWAGGGGEGASSAAGMAWPAAIVAAILGTGSALQHNNVSSVPQQLKGNGTQDILHSQNWQNHVPQGVTDTLQPWSDLHGVGHLQDFPKDMWKASMVPFSYLKKLF
jgi:hypothetical protein